jgi:hypothetical protein
MLCSRADGMQIIGTHEAFFLEEFSFDSQKQELTLNSVNLTFANVVTLEENCIYRADPKNPSQTEFIQSAHTTAHVFALASRVEQFTTSQFLKNAVGVCTQTHAHACLQMLIVQGRKIMEEAIAKVKVEQLFPQ